MDGRVVGFARVSTYSDRCVYDGVGEHGVFVDAAARGHGVGRRLLDALARAAEAHGIYKLTSRITTNAPSRAARRVLAHIAEAIADERSSGRPR